MGGWGWGIDDNWELDDGLMTQHNNCQADQLIMQDQSLLPLSCLALSQDRPLLDLFEAVEDREVLTFEQPGHPIQLISICRQDLEKGYASDDSPNKLQRLKRIRKRRGVGMVREEGKQKRTKLYIESLESRIVELQGEVQKLKELNKLNLDYIRRLNESEHVVNGFFVDRQKIFAKIQRLTELEGADQRRIELQCKSVRLKQGAFGQERVKAINYYFKQLIEMIMPNAYKYLNWTAHHNLDLFNPDSIEHGPCPWRREMFSKLSLSPSTLTLIAGHRPQIIAIKDQFQQKMLQMYQTKCEMILLARQTELILEKFNETLTPLQTGRFLCYLEKYKFENSMYIEEPIRKMYEELENEKRFSYGSVVPIVEE